jgi:NADH:ubiquinone oxidoreductase subunit H
MNLAWKVMLPLGLVNLVVVAVLVELFMSGYLQGAGGAFWMIVAGWITLVASVAAAALAAPWFADNRPRLDLPASEDAYLLPR